MKTLLLAAAGLALLAPAVASATTTTYFSGQKCLLANLLVNGEQAASSSGLENPDDESHHVYCPASWTSGASDGQANAQITVDAATLVYTDTSSGSFECNIIGENWDGSVYASYSLFSCPTSGGCTQDSNSSWQGSGQLNWPRGLFPNFSGALYPTGIAVSCRQPGSGSTVRGYNVSVN